MCHTSFQSKGLAWNAQPHLCRALHSELWGLSWQRWSAGTGQAVWLRDRDTIAGLPVPPSGGQKMLKGHPSLRPGCCGAQQTCPRWASLSCPHLARPTCLQQLSQNHAGSAGPASLPPTLVHSGPWRLYKAAPWEGQRNLLQVQFANHIKYSPVKSLGFSPV